MTIWLQISSGRGPLECQWVTAGVFEKLTNAALRFGLEVRSLDSVTGDVDGTLKSVLLAIEGDTTEEFAHNWTGTIQWVGRSLQRPKHKRKNWFVGISCFSPTAETEMKMEEIRFDAIKSSGPGGQHVNKSHTAIRATHLPTGLAVVAQEKRSQLMNRKLATARLQTHLKMQNFAARQQTDQKMWAQHDELERGNPVQIFRGNVG